MSTDQLRAANARVLAARAADLQVLARICVWVQDRYGSQALVGAASWRDYKRRSVSEAEVDTARTKEKPCDP